MSDPRAGAAIIILVVFIGFLISVLSRI